MTADRRVGPDVRSYLELARVPNLFTALADIVAAWFVTQGGLEISNAATLIALGFSTWCLYLGGVVLNDYFDRDVDARERPRRPIPSGRIAPAAALRFGAAAMLVGLLAAWLAPVDNHLRTGATATALAAMVVAYDAWLKRTPLGPLAMGGCRGLNWLLGMSLAAGGWQPAHWAIAGGVTVYITGVTWFARREAGGSSRGQLGGGLAVMLAGLALVWYAVQLDAGARQAIFALEAPYRWGLLIAVLAAFLVRRACLAIAQPTPRYVQLAVKHAIFSLVMIDAAVAYAFAGPWAAALVLSLLAPTIVLARFISPT